MSPSLYARERELHIALTLTLSPRRGDMCADPLPPYDTGTIYNLSLEIGGNSFNTK